MDETLKLRQLTFEWDLQEECVFGPLNMIFEPGSIVTLLGQNGV